MTCGLVHASYRQAVKLTFFALCFEYDPLIQPHPLDLLNTAKNIIPYTRELKTLEI